MKYSYCYFCWFYVCLFSVFLDSSIIGETLLILFTAVSQALRTGLAWGRHLINISWMTKIVFITFLISTETKYLNVITLVQCFPKPNMVSKYELLRQPLTTLIISNIQTFLLIVLVSLGCPNKVPQMWRFKTIEI